MVEEMDRRPKLAVDADMLAKKWFRAVRVTSYVPLPPAELRRRFGDLSNQVIAYMDSDQTSSADAEAIGAALAGLGLNQPEALGHTQELLSSDLLVGSAAETALALQPRLAKLLGGLATGFSRQAREVILAHQEDIRRALLAAQRQAEQALRESEDRHRRLVETLPVGIAVLRGRQLVVANPALADILGAASLEEIYRHPVVFFVHPDHREIALSRLDELLQSQDDPPPEEYRLTRVDGSHIYVEATVYRYQDQGEPALQVVIRDITESRMAAEALRNRERLFRELAETTQAFIAVLRSNRVIYANAMAARLTGYAPEELRDLPFEQLVPPELLEHFDNLLRATSASAAPAPPFEAQLISKGGARFWVEVSFGQIDYEGEPASLVTAFDITGRKQTESALRESVALFQTLAETTNAAIFLYKGERHIYVNQAAARMSGYSVAELLDMPYVETVHPDYREIVRERARARLQRQPAPVSYQVPLLTKSGEVRWVDFTGSTIEYHGEPAGLGTAFDITEARQTQDTLRQYARRLELLSEIDQASLRDRSKREITMKALELIADLVPVDRAVITEAVMGDDRHAVVAVWPSTQVTLSEGQQLPLRSWDSLREEQFRGHIYIPDIDVLPELAPMQQIILAEGIRAYVVVPLIFGEKVLGFLNIGSFQPHAYTATHIEVAEETARRLALALRNAQLFEELEANRQHLQELSRQLVRVQEMERRHIARELHDEVSQTLTALNINLELATHLAPDQRMDRLAEAQALLRTLSGQVRELSLRLRPAMLDDFGLLPTLLWYFDRLSDQFGLEVVLEHQGVDQRFDPEVETVVYRIVQEALTNIVRYAGVTKAFVRLWADANTISVQVEDRGSGFDLSRILQLGQSSGLSGMRERTRLLGGHFVLESTPGAGTCITALLPISQLSHESTEARS